MKIFFILKYEYNKLLYFNYFIYYSINYYVYFFHEYNFNNNFISIY